MEAPEVPTEQLHEEINHHAEHSNNGWERGAFFVTITHQKLI